MTRRVWSTTTGLLVSAGSLAAMAALLVAAELGTRALFPEPCARVRQEAEKVDAARRYLAPCFARERRGGEEYLIASPVPGSGAPPAPLPLRRTAGVPRIAVVGASSADLLAKALAKLHDAPGCGDFEVLNCAQPGSALEHVERRFGEVLDYQPDAIVLLFGHNLFFRFSLDEEKLRLRGLLAKSCLLSQLAPAVAPAGTAGLEARLGTFEKFLRRAAAKARAANATLAIATMPANLWLPPASGPREEYDPRFLEARFLEASGRPADAVRLLEALAAKDGSAEWHYQLGVRLARAGGAGGRAYRELHLALDEDSLRMRAPSRLNDLLRHLAAEKGLPLYDAQRVLERQALGGLPGWESFIDNCHLLPAPLDDEAVAVLSLLRDAARLPASCEPKPSASSDKGVSDILTGVFNLTASGPPEVAELWYQGLALAVQSWIGRDPEAADHDVNAFLEGAAFSGSRGEDRHTRLLVAIAEGYDRAGRHDRALALNERARQDGGAEPWIQKGLFHLRRGEPDQARRAFERALTLDGSRDDARSFLRWLSQPGLPAPNGAPPPAG